MGTCTRCGAFVTPATSQRVFKKVHCLACAARPEVNLPKAYRDAMWGKRDSWAWFYGVAAVLALLRGAGAAIDGTWPVAGVALALGVLQALFWAGWKPARLGLLVVSLALGILALASGILPAIFQVVVGLSFVVRAILSTRNKLFFEIEPTEDELISAWSAAQDNHVALWARGLAIVALMSCLAWVGIAKVAFGTLALGALAVALGGVGLSRVNPDTMPPIGQRNAALFGIIGGALGVVAAGVFLWASGLLP